jgi:hypothetical protein
LDDEGGTQLGSIEVRTLEVGAVNHPWLPPVAFEIIEQRLTVRSLIERAVTEQVRDLAAQVRLRSGPEASAARDVQRAYLTRDEIEELRTRGMVRLAQANTEPEIPSLADAVDKACTAFVRGRFLVAVDGRQLTELDEEVIVTGATNVDFIRLVPLVGG